MTRENIDTLIHGMAILCDSNLISLRESPDFSGNEKVRRQINRTRNELQALLGMLKKESNSQG